MRILLILLLASATWSQAQEPPKSAPVAKTNRANTAQDKKASGDEHQPAKDELPSIKQSGERAPEKEHATADANEELDINRRLATFTGILALVGALQLIALTVQAFIFWRTLKENRNLIGAASNSADAAKASSKTAEKALRLTERADILLEAIEVTGQPRLSGDSAVIAVFRNYGRTRGDRAQATARVFLSGEALAQDVESPQPTPIRILGPGNSMRVGLHRFHDWMSEEGFQAMLDGRATLRFEVEVVYWDVFQDPHRTKCLGAYSIETASFQFDQNQEAD
jgi:hypothetical protein